jgi:hypothetical protein
MTKQEALRQLKSAIEDYNDELDNLQSSIGNLDTIEEPNDTGDADNMDIDDLPDSLDIPSTRELERALDAVSEALEVYQEIVDKFEVVFTVTITVEGADGEGSAANLARIKLNRGEFDEAEVEEVNPLDE